MVIDKNSPSKKTHITESDSAWGISLIDMGGYYRIRICGCDVLIGAESLVMSRDSTPLTSTLCTDNYTDVT